MASTRWISALCAGSSKDTNLKKDRNLGSGAHVRCVGKGRKEWTG
jgi:hypothetical protein